MEKRETFDGLVGEALELGGDGKRLLTENIGKTVAVITAVLAVLLTFLDVALPELSLRSVTTEVIIMLIAAYIIYFSLDEAGEEAGRRTEGYETARNAYRDVRTKIGGETVEALSEFCLEYSRSELEFRKRQLLVGEAVPESEYERYRRGEEYDRRNERLFCRLDRMKATLLEPKELLEYESGESGGGLKNPRATKPFRMLTRLLPLTLSTLFTVSMIITAKEGLDLSQVLGGLVKLGCLPIVALRGYAGGYAYATESLVRWYDKRREVLLRFFDWQEKRQAKNL